MPQALRILHCMRSPVGGLFRHVCDLTEEQARLGYQIGLICDSTTGGEHAKTKLEAVQPYCELGIVQVPMSRNLGPRDFTAYLAARRFAKTINANIIHGHGAKGGALARLTGRSLKQRFPHIGVFYTPHGGSLHYSRDTNVGKVFLTLEERLGRYTDGLIFESAYSKNVYEQKVGPPPCEIRVIPNGLLAEEFAEIQLNEQASDFLFIGELRHLKGVDILLEALARVNSAQAATATIVGSGPDEEEFKHQAELLGLNSRVNFVGVKPAREAFALGRCLVVPSRAESFPYIVLEAAAAQIPMIATNVGGIPEIYDQTGIELIAPDMAEPLRQKMNGFLETPAPFVSEAQTLKQRVEENFTVETMTDAIVNFYFDKLPD